MKIVWLDINASYSHSSLAIPALDAQLSKEQRESHDWAVISGTIKSPESWFINRLLKEKPSLILATAWLYNHLILRTLLIKITKLIPTVKVLLGGPEFLGDNEEYLRQNRHITALFRGEGEEIFPRFIDSLNGANANLELSGFCYIDSNGNYRDNGEAIVSGFDQLKFPESSLFFRWDRPFVQLESSRGCFNHCSFCVSGGGRRVEDLSIEVVKERVERLYQRGIREIRVLDRTFNANPKRALKLLSLFNSYNGEIEFHLELHPAFLTESIKEELSKSKIGTLHLEAGVQSLREKPIVSCQRAGGIEATLEGVIFLTESVKGESHTDFIAGLPHYSYSELVEDIEEMIKISPGEIQLESLKLLPGTKLRERAEEFGIKYSPLPPYEVLESNHISYSELQLSMALSKILDFYYNQSLWRKPFIEIVLSNRGFLEEFTNYFYANEISHHLSQESRGRLLWDYCTTKNLNSTHSIAVAWMEGGLSFRRGPGLLSKEWKEGNPLHNPLYSGESRERSYRYLEIEGERIWFLYNRKKKSSKAIEKFKEIL